MPRQIIIPSGNVFIDKPFSCFLSKEGGEVTIVGGNIIPIYSAQGEIRVENEGVPIKLSSLREIYLQIKTEPLTNKITKAKFVTDYDVKEIKKKSDSSLNMFLPICRYNKSFGKIDSRFLNANFNYTRQRGDKPLQGYYDDGKVYINGFLLHDEIFNSPLRQMAFPPKIISAGEGDFIIIKVSAEYDEDPEKSSQITELNVQRGEPYYQVVEEIYDSTDTGERSSYGSMSLERNYPIGYVKGGSYVSLHTENIFISVASHERLITSRVVSLKDGSEVTEYKTRVDYSISI